MVTMVLSCMWAQCPKIGNNCESMGQRVTCKGALHPQKYTKCIPQDEPQTAAIHNGLYKIGLNKGA